MRVIFMGTPDFSVGTLEALIEAGHFLIPQSVQIDDIPDNDGSYRLTEMESYCS